MTSSSKIFISFLLAIGLWAGCSASTSGESGDSGVDAGHDGDVDPDNPDEGDMPQDLPTLCQADIIQAPASEESDFVDGNPKGDGRFPDIGFDENAVMAWAYYAPEPAAVWEIQVTPYVPADLHDGGVGGTQPGPIQNPFTAGPVSKKPAVAGRSDVYGLVWLDGRWDSSCPEEEDGGVEDCNMEVAFARVDALGNPIGGNPEPTRITSTPVSKVIDRPHIAATDSGWILVWLEMDSTGTRVVAGALDQEGNTAGPPHVISTETNVETSAMPSVAAVGNVAVVVWGVINQQKILARVLNQLAEPQNSAPTVLDEGTLCVKPRIAAGNSNFLVSWSKMRGTDQEVFTRKLDATGSPLGEPHRITWTPKNVISSVPAWNGSSYGLAWLSAHANGQDQCAVESCDIQVFASLLDEHGTLASEPIRLSNDPNSCQDMDLSWDGSGFTAVWTLPRGQTIAQFRYQVFYGRALCD